MGRSTKAEEYRLITNMENALPTDMVLAEFAAIILNKTGTPVDDRVRLAAIVKWMEWRVGKPKENKDTNHSYEINVPKITFK